MKSLFFLFSLTIIFASCEKIIELDLSNNVSKIIIEGSVTDEAGPYYVKLSKSVNFNEPNTYSAVTGAMVIIKDNMGQVDTLKHVTNGLYKTNGLIGISGRTYYLIVVAEGKTYTAESTMPNRVTLDSLRIIYSKVNGDTNINIVPMYVDPSTLGNNYLLKQWINNKLDKTYYAFNDNLNNGRVNQRPLRSADFDLEILSGDNVQIELQCVSSKVYTYYYSLGEQTGGGPGGGTTPANPPNNIIGDALGIFSAHTTQKRSIIIP